MAGGDGMGGDITCCGLGRRRYSKSGRGRGGEALLGGVWGGGGLASLAGGDRMGGDITGWVLGRRRSSKSGRGRVVNDGVLRG